MHRVVPVLEQIGARGLGEAIARGHVNLRAIEDAAIGGPRQRRRLVSVLLSIYTPVALGTPEGRTSCSGCRPEAGWEPAWRALSDGDDQGATCRRDDLCAGDRDRAGRAGGRTDLGPGRARCLPVSDRQTATAAAAGHARPAASSAQRRGPGRGPGAVVPGAGQLHRRGRARAAGPRRARGHLRDPGRRCRICRVCGRPSPASSPAARS